VPYIISILEEEGSNTPSHEVIDSLSDILEGLMIEDSKNEEDSKCLSNEILKKWSTALSMGKNS